MTAELSQLFRTKRDGVSFVLDAIVAALPDADVSVYAVDGRFLTIDAARAAPLRVAAANWSATARIVATMHPDAILIDVGTTTTDVVPIVGGAVKAIGATDPERLACGELLYTGALRTPVEAIVREAPFRGSLAAVSAEGFAIVGDVHLWRGALDAADYTVPTPDGRPVTRSAAGERLARVVCGDREMVDESGVEAIASHVADAQSAAIAGAIARVRSRHPGVDMAVVAGLGHFIAADAAHTLGMRTISLAGEWSESGSRAAPASAVALLLEQSLGLTNAARQDDRHGVPDERAAVSGGGRAVLTVIKLGGGLLARDGALDRIVAALATHAPPRTVIVPGGGPFADAVRAAERRHAGGDDAAHWMAILAMDQYAHLLTARLQGAVLADSAAQVWAALDRGALPVLAPYRWLRESDPLPHSWSVTSDSIAAWIAARLAAPELVLVKPVDGDLSALTDAHFASALEHGTTARIVAQGSLAAWLAQRSVPA